MSEIDGSVRSSDSRIYLIYPYKVKVSRRLDTNVQVVFLVMVMMKRFQFPYSTLQAQFPNLQAQLSNRIQLCRRNYFIP